MTCTSYNRREAVDYVNALDGEKWRRLAEFLFWSFASPPDAKKRDRGDPAFCPNRPDRLFAGAGAAFPPPRRSDIGLTAKHSPKRLTQKPLAASLMLLPRREGSAGFPHYRR